MPHLCAACPIAILCHTKIRTQWRHALAKFVSEIRQQNVNHDLIWFDLILPRASPHFQQSASKAFIPNKNFPPWDVFRKNGPGNIRTFYLLFFPFLFGRMKVQWSKYISQFLPLVDLCFGETELSPWTIHWNSGRVKKKTKRTPRTSNNFSNGDDAQSWRPVPVEQGTTKLFGWLTTVLFKQSVAKAFACRTMESRAAKGPCPKERWFIFSRAVFAHLETEECEWTRREFDLCGGCSESFDGLMNGYVLKWFAVLAFHSSCQQRYRQISFLLRPHQCLCRRLRFHRVWFVLQSDVGNDDPTKQEHICSLVSRTEIGVLS